ncbi:MAG: DUF697 domain-containing protein [Inquilinus limosus]|uniref:DUF697 domain-containing protein n=1 Tax=Inquilinus limosus TaxID=171674 RepID=A0A952FME7_9PROT|nr:DUF697 domain-containing protein [Inquilinus limosus]
MDAAEPKPSLESAALRIVNSYMGWSAGAGLIPLPGIDLAAISGVQLKMVHALSKLYGLPFSRDAAKSVIGALVGGGSTYILAAPVGSIVKAVPVVGLIAGALTQPALAAATTYALGKVFIQHFETGGNLLNFNADDLRRYYSEQLAVAQKTGPGAAKAD